MTDENTDVVGPEALEDEREFLLRSLDDLDSELLAGNIDLDTYRVLHDDYTARAAAVIKTIADGVERDLPTGARAPARLRFVTIGGVVVFAVLAAFLLAHSAGQRRAGQTITGNSQIGGSSPTTAAVSVADAIANAKAAAAAQPKSYTARINYARTLLAAGQQYYSIAVQEYIVATKLDPKQAEPVAYTGWLTTLFAASDTNATEQRQLFAAAGDTLDRAIRLDPTYPPSYVFKGLLLSRYENKLCEGATQLEEYLARAPATDPFHEQVLSALSSTVKNGNCPTTLPTTPTTKP